MVEKIIDRGNSVYYIYVTLIMICIVKWNWCFVQPRCLNLAVNVHVVTVKHTSMYY